MSTLVLLALRAHRSFDVCCGCQFGPTPDFSVHCHDVTDLRGRQEVECHRRPGVACAGLARERALRPRADGDYYWAQTEALKEAR